MTFRLLPPLACICLALALCGMAGAQVTTSALSEAADALRADTVYVDPDAERAISTPVADDLRKQIREADAGPIRIAILPDRARDEAGGDATAAARAIARDVGEPGTYAVLVGDSLRAGNTEGLPAGEAASQALEGSRSAGTGAVLADFVRRMGDASSGSLSRDGRSPTSRDRDGGGGGAFLVFLLGIPLVLFAVSRSRRRRERRDQQAQLEEVKQFARDDLVSLGEDIRALDLDIEMPNASPAAKQHYGRAVECYTSAEQAWDDARHVDDMERVSSLLEEGRFEMIAAKAELEGEPVPERRLPCFFDPRHGPSTTDVEWAPPGGAPRVVPVCAADATRIADGYEPDARQVAVGGQMTPYWNAGPAYMPWAGGFFGGGLLPGLFLGSMLGGGLGMFGGWSDADAGGLGGGGFGGGDFGGGGGFGGGDFGGGDF
jgi:hypothetical protein